MHVAPFEFLVLKGFAAFFSPFVKHFLLFLQ